MRVKQQIARIVRRLWRTRQPIHRPELSEQEFVRFMSRASPYTQHTGIASALPTEVPADMNRLAWALRERVGQRFFFAPDQVESLASGLIERDPEWTARLAQASKSLIFRSLPIYGRHGPPLDGTFPWANLEAGPGNDSLYPFRPQRFAFLPRLALAARLDQISPEHLTAVLDGWMRDAARGINPRCYGTNLVVIQRLLATLCAWMFVAKRTREKDAPFEALENRLLRILLADTRFLEPRLGTSTPNNHLLADRFAAWLLHVLVPEFLENDHTTAGDEFRDELLRQTYPDGGGFEHATHYHEYACEMAGAYLALCHVQGRSVDKAISARAEAMLRLHMALTGPECIPVHVGNAAEDPLFPLDAGGGWCPGALRELYRALFDGGHFQHAPTDDITVERAYWWTGGALESPAAGIEQPFLQSFPQAGFHVHSDPELCARLVVRSGPAPDTLVHPGHMHADLLSIHLIVDGQPLLVDGGTFSYRRDRDSAEPDWRGYFIGPKAHNTLAIGDHDPLGPTQRDFRCSDPLARVRSRSVGGSGLAWTEGCIHGGDVYDGFTRRCIHVFGSYWIIHDILPHSERAELPRWLGFQSASGTRVTMADYTVRVTMAGQSRATLIATDGTCGPDPLEGSREPVGGWISPAYGKLVAASQVRYPLSPETRETGTLISPHGDNCGDSIAIKRLSESAIVCQVATPTGQDVILLNEAEDPAAPIDHDGLCFHGRLAWLRLTAGRLAEIRWLDSFRIEWNEQGLIRQFRSRDGTARLDDQVR